MTMRARLERWTGWDDEPGNVKLPASLDPASNGVILRLVVERPASSVGKRIELHINGDEVLDVLRWMRYEATRQRETTEREAMQQR